MVLRGATAEDEAFLWQMLLHAAHAGDEVDGVEALKGLPELARYVEGWGRPSDLGIICLLYTSPSPRDRQKSRMPSSA